MFSRLLILNPFPKSDLIDKMRTKDIWKTSMNVTTSSKRKSLT